MTLLFLLYAKKNLNNKIFIFKSCILCLVEKFKNLDNIHVNTIQQVDFQHAFLFLLNTQTFYNKKSSELETYTPQHIFVVASCRFENTISQLCMHSLRQFNKRADHSNKKFNVDNPPSTM